MPKSKENDLLILIQSLKHSTTKLFRKQLKSSSQKGNPIKLKLFEAIQKSTFDKALFIKKNQLDLKKFNYLKFSFFQDLINFLKTNYNDYSDIALQHEVIEYELLLKYGLFNKAARRLKMIKTIAIEKCDFEIACLVQRKAFDYRLFNHINKTDAIDEASKEMKQYQLLSNNLHSYALLNHQILKLHYNFLDKRIKDRDAILMYLDHPLLKDEANAKSVMAKYHFNLIKSLIYLGDNNFKQSKKYALNAYLHLNKNSSEYRNDYNKLMKAMNNYLDSSLNLSETKPFEVMYPKMIELANTVDAGDTLTKALTFQLLCSLQLNYLWLKRDFSSFLIECTQFEKDYETYETYLSPNFKLEILLSIARMFFWNGNYEKADFFCERIASKKFNPTSLFIVCGNLLRVMSNIEMGNYQLIPHLINTGKYFFKKRDRLFEMELCFLNGINKLKPYYSAPQKKRLFMKLYEEINSKIVVSGGMIIDKKIDLIKWLRQKSEQ